MSVYRDQWRNGVVVNAYRQRMLDNGMNPDPWQSDEIGRRTYEIAESFDGDVQALITTYLAFYEAEVNDSVDREAAFTLFSVVTGESYNVFYDAWLNT